MTPDEAVTVFVVALNVPPPAVVPSEDNTAAIVTEVLLSPVTVLLNVSWIRKTGCVEEVCTRSCRTCRLCRNSNLTS